MLKEQCFFPKNLIMSIINKVVSKTHWITIANYYFPEKFHDNYYDYAFNPFVTHLLLWGKIIYLRFSGYSEVNASELLENLEDIFFVNDIRVWM